MRSMVRTFLACCLAISSTAFTANCAELVINGDFETDVEDFIVWPGYVGGTNDAGDFNPDSIPDWLGTGGHGINPVFSETNPVQIVDWPGTGGHGINPIATGEAPFRDNGENETTVALMQGSATIQQQVSGLTVGGNYTLSWGFNARNCCGDFPIGGLSLNGSTIDVSGFSDEEVFPVGDFEPWYEANVDFVADAADLAIEFSSMASLGGDATLLLDDISLLLNGGGNNLISNGDFETDAEDFFVWPGYTGTGQSAPFRDNGDNNTSVAFLQGASSLTQEVGGFTAGEEYVLSLDFNARNCCGDVPVAELYLDGDLVEDFPGEDFDAGIVEPVGGDEPWYHFEMTFTADKSAYEVLVQTYPAEGGDSTLVIDNVSILGVSDVVLGDFTGDGELTAIDIDLLSEEVRAGTNLAEFDVNSDGLVNESDRTLWVETLKNTYFGDANLDGEFNSSDFVQVFQSGKYEDDIALNATWADGDWNGDQEFNSSDFVIAFQGGGFEIGPRQATNSVPEPSAIVLLLVGIGVICGHRRKA